MSAAARAVARWPWAEIWRRSSALVAVAVTALIVGAVQSPPPKRQPAPAQPGLRAIMRDEAEQAAPQVQLSPAASAPQPLAQLPPVPVRAHEIFAFAPYWTLDAAPTFAYRRLTTVAYFGVDVAPDGTVQQSGAGWDGYSSQQLVDLIDEAHAAGDRVVLTAKNFDDGQLHTLVRDPQAPARLAAALSGLVRAKNMDGVNFDFEGTDAGDRDLYTAFATSAAHLLKQADAQWQVTVDTYGNAASDPTSYMNAAALAPAFDALFVMAYDMYADGHASPNAALGADESVLAAYTSVMPPAKVILGLPFYGYDWQTADGEPLSRSAQPPQPQTYAQLQGQHLQLRWDAADDVPWAAYQQDGQWHEVYFDDPTSLALKARAADSYGVVNVGIWALGFDGGDPAMLAAVHGVGGAPPQPSPSPRPKPAPQPSPTRAPAPQPKPSPSPTGGGGSGLPNLQPSPSPCPSPSPNGLGLPLPGGC